MTRTKDLKLNDNWLGNEPKQDWKKNARKTNQMLNRNGKYNCYKIFVGKKFVNQIDVCEMNINSVLNYIDKLANETGKGLVIELDKDYDFGGGIYPWGHTKLICVIGGN